MVLKYVDDGDEALLPLLIEASGLTTRAVFMPHGENLILVMDEHVPVRALLEDITEEAAILSPDVELPATICLHRASRCRASTGCRSATTGS